VEPCETLGESPFRLRPRASGLPLQESGLGVRREESDQERGELANTLPGDPKGETR
jgi:hypothetical protein